MGIFKRSASQKASARAPSENASERGSSQRPRSPLYAPLQLITGKGGVGRTTVTIHLGRAHARRGGDTLILEVRDAESEMGEEGSYGARADSMLGRSLAQELGVSTPYRLGPDPLEIEPHLWAAQLVAPVGHELFLRSLIPSGRLARAALESRGLSRFLRSAPSMHELGVYYHLAHLQRDSRFERVIVDLPASGHTLALTELPERIARILRRGALVDALREGVGRIADPEYTALWIVTLPEELPISEALELHEALRGDHITPAGVVLNRALPRALSQDEISLLKETLTRISSSSKTPDTSSSLEERLLSATVSAALTEQALMSDLEVFTNRLTLPELPEPATRVAHIESAWLSRSEE